VAQSGSVATWKQQHTTTVRRPSNRVSMGQSPSPFYTNLLDVNLTAVSISGWDR